jgi:hypothetical protein
VNEQNKSSEKRQRSEPKPIRSGGGGAGGFHLPDIRPRRAIDLLPCLPDNEWTQFSKPLQRKELVTFVETYSRTGFLRMTNEKIRARATALCLKGRIVGCIYGEPNLEPQLTKPALRLMLDLPMDDSYVAFTLHEEDVVQAVSSLFLGYPIECEEDLDPPSYFEHITEWMQANQHTGCLTVDSRDHGMHLAFVHKGAFIGMFSVLKQDFIYEIQQVHKLCEDPVNAISAFMVPDDLQIEYGYKLSEELPQRE